MSDSRHLIGPRAKVKRAVHCIDDLRNSVGPIDQTNSGLFIVESDSQTGSRVGARIPGDWSLTIGDCVHNLRSALDHLIWGAVIANGNAAPGRQICFPIYPRSDSLPDRLDGKNGRIEGAGQKVRDIIYEINPCRGGDTLFCLLHDLDIEDKHKVLTEVRATAAEGLSLMKVVEGTRTELATADFGELRPEDHVELLISSSDTTPGQYVEAAVQITFGEGPAEGMLVVLTLLDLTNATNEVIDVFEAQVFSTSAPAPKTSPR